MIKLQELEIITAIVGFAAIYLLANFGIRGIFGTMTYAILYFTSFIVSTLYKGYGNEILRKLAYFLLLLTLFMTIVVPISILWYQFM